MERCNADEETTPTLLVSKVQNSLGNIKNSFVDRARNKSQKTYEIARIGLYNDGNIENSPFDLITDLQEIDKIIFSEELEYEGESNALTDEQVQDFIDGIWNDPITDAVEDLIPDDEESDDTEDTTGGGIIPPILDPFVDGHVYVCPIDGENGLDESIEDDILDDIEGGGSDGSSGGGSTWVYPGGDVSNGASWGGPFPGMGPDGSYSEVRDSWKCDPGQFFCIIIEFQKSNYGLAGGETVAIDKILSKAKQHLEKTANSSVKQGKVPTNNFEMASIVKNLPDMLRGL